MSESLRTRLWRVAFNLFPAYRGLDPGESVDREYAVDLVSADGTVHAHVEKTVYVRRDE